MNRLGLVPVGLVAVGGAVGAWARYRLAVAWPVGTTGWPWATLTTNLSGAFALGLLVADRGERSSRGRLLWRAFAGAGLLGGFTTFSTVALQLDRQLGGDRPLLATAYALVSVVGGIAAARVGLRLATRTGR